MTSKNQAAWTQLFKTHQVLACIENNGSFVITANQIKPIREPRLMTKFDHRHQLPDIFTENNLALLPLTRGSYVLGKFNIFHQLEEVDVPLSNVAFTNCFESLDFDNITSESNAISCVFVAKILEDFLGEEVTPTVSGRMTSNTFDFQIDVPSGMPKRISVNKAQIEIDGGYESESCLTLIEAKNYLADDFVIRQLYYPYRRWQGVMSKPIRNVFLTYSNGVFELREYAFGAIEHYNSIHLIHCKRYAVCNFLINYQTIRELIETTAIENEPDYIPFPQADSFDRLINLCELLSQQDFLTKEKITAKYGFDRRQTDYYVNAGKYLSLIREEGEGFTLTENARAIFAQHIQLRRKSFIQRLVAKKVFRDALEQYFRDANIPARQHIIGIMKAAGLSMAETTCERRASTVASWINWIVGQIET